MMEHTRYEVFELLRKVSRFTAFRVVFPKKVRPFSPQVIELGVLRQRVFERLFAGQHHEQYYPNSVKVCLLPLVSLLLQYFWRHKSWSSQKCTTETILVPPFELCCKSEIDYLDTKIFFVDHDVVKLQIPMTHAVWVHVVQSHEHLLEVISANGFAKGHPGNRNDIP